MALSALLLNFLFVFIRTRLNRLPTVKTIMSRPLDNLPNRIKIFKKLDRRIKNSNLKSLGCCDPSSESLHVFVSMHWLKFNFACISLNSSHSIHSNWNAGGGGERDTY